MGPCLCRLRAVGPGLGPAALGRGWAGAAAAVGPAGRGGTAGARGRGAVTALLARAALKPEMPFFCYYYRLLALTCLQAIWRKSCRCVQGGKCVSLAAFYSFSCP